MKINNINKVGRIIDINQSGENNKNVVVLGDNYNTMPAEMLEFLGQLIEKVDNSDKNHVKTAIACVKERDQKGFIKAMKLLGKHTISIVENIAATVIYEWLHNNGIL